MGISKHKFAAKQALRWYWICHYGFTAWLHASKFTSRYDFCRFPGSHFYLCFLTTVGLFSYIFQRIHGEDVFYLDKGIFIIVVLSVSWFSDVHFLVVTFAGFHMLYFENALLDFLVTSVIDVRKSGWCLVSSILLALFKYWKWNLMKENCFGKKNNSKIFMHANESSLTNQNEPHASFNPSQSDGFAGHVG